MNTCIDSPGDLIEQFTFTVTVTSKIGGYNGNIKVTVSCALVCRN